VTSLRGRYTWLILGSSRDSTLDALFEEGRRAWPGIAVDRAQFDPFVAERAGGDPSSLRGADVYLVCACAHGDERALAEIHEHYIVKVPAFLAHTRAGTAFIDEVRQEVLQRLFVDGKIRHYTGRGPLLSWLRVVTVRVASNLRAKDKPHAELDDSVHVAGLDPELAIIRRRYGDTFRSALRDALEGLAPEDRSLLRLYYLDGLNIEKLAGVFRTSRATVGRRLVAVRERLLMDTQRLLRDRLHATPNELASLLRLVRDDLGVSLSRILREPA
jgi:RNA polymerase sigma-70 factor (ECF subfamily)